MTENHKMPELNFFRWSQRWRHHDPQLGRSQTHPTHPELVHRVSGLKVILLLHKRWAGPRRPVQASHDRRRASGPQDGRLLHRVWRLRRRNLQQHAALRAEEKLDWASHWAQQKLIFGASEQKQKSKIFLKIIWIDLLIWRGKLIFKKSAKIFHCLAALLVLKENLLG